MPKNIVLIQAHPDPAPERFCRVLAETYTRAAHRSGHDIQVLNLATMSIPLLRTKSDYESGPAPAAIQSAQAMISAADHLVIIFPLWLGDMPALLKGFLEQLLRPGFAYGGSTEKGLPKKLLKGKSARIVITMGMPAAFYRFFFRAHSLKNLKRNILAFCGVSPIRDSLIGLVEGKDMRPRQKWLNKMEEFGRCAM
ncbi:MAG: NAD(P)H-dependent oxidoreductase [Rhodospirillaceae bacterium]